MDGWAEPKIERNFVYFVIRYIDIDILCYYIMGIGIRYIHIDENIYHKKPGCMEVKI
jgi:hypothetical protein